MRTTDREEWLRQCKYVMDNKISKSSLNGLHMDDNIRLDYTVSILSLKIPNKRC